MNTRDIRNFMAVIEAGSMSKAAQQLYITPQGLSKSIKSLEEEVGVVLFMRTARGIKLTERGRIFLKKAEKLYSDLKELEDLFAGDVDSVSGKIRISSALGILAQVTPEYLLSFNKRFPNVEINIMEHVDSRVDLDVGTEIADIGLAKEPVDHNRFHVYPIDQVRHCVLIYKGHPLFDRDAISVKDLKDEKIIIESRDFKVYNKFMHFCKGYGFEPSIYFETTEISMAHKLAHLKKGVAITIEPEANSIKYDNLKPVYFEEEFNCEWVAITKKEINPITKEMLAYLGCLS